IVAQPGYSRLAHRRVRFHRSHLMAGVEEQLAGNAGAGTDIGDLPRRRHAVLTLQPIEQRGRIVGPITHVVGDAVAESLGPVQFVNAWHAVQGQNRCTPTSSALSMTNTPSTQTARCT